MVHDANFARRLRRGSIISIPIEIVGSAGGLGGNGWNLKKKLSPYEIPALTGLEPARLDAWKRYDAIIIEVDSHQILAVWQIEGGFWHHLGKEIG